MMNAKHIISLLLICIVLFTITPVAATPVLNLSMISMASGTSVGEIESFIPSSGQTSGTDRNYDYTVRRGFTISSFTFIPKDEGHYTIWLKRASGETVTIAIYLTSTTLITGTGTVYMGYTNFTFWYPKEPISGYPLLEPLGFRVGIDKNTKKEYLVTSFKVDPSVNNAQTLILEDDECAYVELNPYVSKDLIPTIGAMGENGMSISGTAISASNYQKAEMEAGKNACNTILCQWGLDWMQTLIDDFYKNVTKLGGIVATILGTLWDVATLVFAVELFAGLNVLYLAISILMALDESDDVFQVFGKIVQRLRKLGRFYMEIYKWIKSIILPWV